jgi:PKD repeat protein
MVRIANLSPTADFTFSPSEPVENQEIQFTDRSSDSEGKLASWNWDFGDGYKSTSQNPTHKYAKAGTYTVTLTVTDDEGVSNTKSIAITVLTPPFWTQAWFYGLVLGTVCITLVVIIMAKRRSKPKTVEKPK